VSDVQPETPETHVYRLSDEHHGWADLDDLVPEAPGLPAALFPLFPTGERAEADGLAVYGGDYEAPHFAASDESVEATPQEMAGWRAAWDGMEQAQRAFRARMETARDAYEATAREALADLTRALEPWEPVEVVLTARSAELAATLHARQAAARQLAEERHEKEQTELDAVHGPRVIVLYQPRIRGERNVTRVHLVDCTRRVTADVEPLRAGDAWDRLVRLSGDSPGMRAKFCGSCRPWKIFAEHIDGFPRPRRTMGWGPILGQVPLTEVPVAWTS
jgi:hypothetical protein